MIGEQRNPITQNCRRTARSQFTKSASEKHKKSPSKLQWIRDKCRGRGASEGRTQTLWRRAGRRFCCSSCRISLGRCRRSTTGHGRRMASRLHGRFFYFVIFVFYKNIFSFSKFTGIYPGRPAAGRPEPGRPAAGRQGLFCKNFAKIFAEKPLEDQSPCSGAAGPQAAQSGPRPPGSRATGSPTLI